MKRIVLVTISLLMVFQLIIISPGRASQPESDNRAYPAIIGNIMPVRTFNSPTSLHVSGMRLLVYDEGNSSIQNIFIQNDYRFGIFGANEGQMYTPGDITTISNKPYITDTVNNKVLVYTSAGKYNSEFNVYNQAGEPLLNRPIGVTSLKGRIFIANSGAGNVVVTDQNGGYVFTISSPVFTMLQPTGIAALNDTIYVTDPKSNSIFLFDYDGNFIKKWNVDNPWAIAIDDDNIYVTSPKKNRAMVLDFEGLITKTIGLNNENKEILSNPKGIEILSGRIIVSSKETNRIEMWNKDGSYAGRFNSEIKPTGSFVRPERITSEGETIYIVDSSRAIVLVYKKSGQFVREIGQNSDVKLVQPSGVCIDATGNIFVVDKADSNIKIYDSDGVYQKTIGSKGSVGGMFREPTDICIDKITNRLYVSDTKNHRIQVLTTDGEFINEFGGWGTTPGQFILPMGICLGEEKILVADYGNCRVQEISLTGNPINSLGSRGKGRGRLLGGTDCSYDNDGKIYVADSFNHRLVIFDPETGFNWNFGDCGGPGDQYHMIPAVCPPDDHDPQAPGFFKFPSGILADSFGCFVADTFNSRIQYIDYTEIFTEWSYIISPTILDFGVIPNGAIEEKKVTVKNISGGVISGIIDIDSSASWLSVRNESFVNDDEPLDFIVDTSGLENGTYKTEVKIITNKDPDGKSTLIHVKMTIGESFSYLLRTKPVIYRESNKKITIPIEVIPQNGFTSTVALSVKNTPPRTYGQYSSNLLKLKSGDLAESILSIRSSTGVTPGVYEITVKGETPKLKYETYFTFTLVVSANLESEPRIVLGETFTAEWCINCPYAHRAAERLVEEYGNSDVAWINYYVETNKVDEAFLYYPPADKRYKWYPGQGLPTTFFDGTNSVVGGDNHEEKKDPPSDKQSCDKFTGTTYTYNRYKKELLESVSKPSSISIFTDTKIEDRTIDANIEIELKESISNNKNMSLYVVLVEDNIEFSALNTDDYHNLICREMYTGSLGEDIDLIEGKLITKKMKLKLPDYVNIKNAGLLVWIQNNGSKSVLQTSVTQFHNQPVVDSYVVTMANDDIRLEVDGYTELSYNITNTSSHSLTLSCLPNFVAEDWDYTIEIEGSEVEAEDVTLVLSPFESQTIIISATPPKDATPGMEASFDIQTSTHKNNVSHNVIDVTTIPRLPPDYTFEPDVKRIEITKGEIEKFNITLDPINDFSGPVTLTDCTGDPSLKVSFNPSNGVPPFQTQVTVTGGEKLKVADYKLCILASGVSIMGDEIEHRLSIPVEVQYAKVLISASPLMIISCSENVACHSANIEIMINTPMEISNIQFSVRYDPTVLTVTHHEFGDFFDSTESTFNFLDRSIEGKITVQINGNARIGKGRLCTIVMRGVKGITKKGTSVEVCDVGAFDSKGNSVLSNVGCTHQKLDIISNLAPPRLKVDAEDGIYIDQERFVITGNTKSSDPDYPVTLTINGRTITLSGEGDWEFSARLREGPNSFVIIARDEAGTSSAKRLVINRDSTAPKIGISNYKSGQVVNETSIQLEGWVDETAEVFVNGTSVELSDFNEFKMSTSLAEGVNKFVLEATDRMGRKTTEEFIIILVRIVKIELWINKNTMVVNGTPMTLPQAPVLSSPPLPGELAGNTYMPIREVAEALYTTVSWDGSERKVTLKQNVKGKRKTIDLWIGKKIAKINGAEVWIDKTHKLYPAIVNNKTMLPLRFVSESLGATVEWISAERKIILTYKP
ncbi:MAG: 6-bladed beta-propeller [Caldisericia bacterium]|nr:6-bladed beta-propeller [Caldisericia bacterium]